MAYDGSVIIGVEADGSAFEAYLAALGEQTSEALAGAGASAEANSQRLAVAAAEAVAAAQRVAEAVPAVLEAAIPDTAAGALAMLAAVTASFTGGIPGMAETGAALFGALTTRLPDITEGVRGAAGALLSSIAGVFTGGSGDMASAGFDLMRGLWLGISGAESWVWSLVRGWCASLIGKIRGYFGISSPSRLMAEKVGRFLPEGIVAGMRETMGEIPEALGGGAALAAEAYRAQLLSRVREAVAAETGAVGLRVSAGLSGAASSGAGKTPAAPEKAVNIEFTGSLAQLARVLRPAIRTEERLHGGSLVE